jgi:hypothetical protein
VPEDSPLQEQQFPGISVNLVSHEEEPNDSNAYQKMITCEWDIGCHVKELSSPKSARQQMKLLISNVEQALRGPDTLLRNLTLSNTFYQAEPISAEFGITINEKGVYQQNGTIRLRTVNIIN